MWKLILLKTSKGTYGDITEEMNLSFEDYSKMMYFVADFFEFCTDNIKVTIEYEAIEKGESKDA